MMVVSVVLVIIFICDNGGFCEVVNKNGDDRIFQGNDKVAASTMAQVTI